MDNVDILLTALEPEIDKKCREIKNIRNEKILTRIFISLAVIMLILPAVLIFAGVSFLTIFAPIIFTAAVFIIVTPIFMSKGEKIYGKAN